MRRQTIGLYCTVLFAIASLCSIAEARDEFGGVRCGHKIRPALVGRTSGDEPVAQIEARHRDLDLKNLGGDEISDSLDAAAWRICGTEYQILYDSRHVVRDVLSFPAHSRVSPAFSGICQKSGQRLQQAVLAILDNGSADIRGTSHYSTRDDTLLSVKAAWRMDEQTKRFVPLATNGLRCPRSGIITADGGP